MSIEKTHTRLDTLTRLQNHIENLASEMVFDDDEDLHVLADHLTSIAGELIFKKFQLVERNALVSKKTA